MTSLLPVAIDACGGDRGESVQVEGAIQAYKEFGCKSFLVGPEDTLRSLIDGFGARDLPLEIVHAAEVIEMGESPTKAVRRKPGASLCVAYNLLESGKASSILSSGNSGAMMAAGRIFCGLLPGIERPAIATIVPKAGDGTPNVFLDSGANVDCHAQNLVQFAVMGSVYYSSLFNKERPKVGLLSNGTESSKGNEIIREAAALLTEMGSVNYIGYVEGRDIAAESADVIVCDGFVGNVMLKAMEGVVRLVFDQLLLEGKRNLRQGVGLFLSRSAYRHVFLEKFDHTAYGGAPLLGLRKLAIVLHGNSDARAVKNAIRIAVTFSKSCMTERIASEITQLDDFLSEATDAFPGTMFDREALLVNGKGRKLGMKGVRKGTEREEVRKERETEEGDA